MNAGKNRCAERGAIPVGGIRKPGCSPLMAKGVAPRKPGTWNGGPIIVSCSRTPEESQTWPQIHRR